MPDSLNPFDLFVIVVAVLMTLWGGMRGVVSQVTSILSWLVSWYVATHYYSFAARFINQDSEWRVPASMIITFIVTALAIRLASNFIKQIISFAGLREFDRQMGALLGLCKGLLLCLMVAFVAVVASDKSRAVIESAKTGPFFVKTVAYVQEKLPDSELTQKFRGLATKIDEEGENNVKSEELEAQVDNLTKGLISKGFLSNNATKIVEEAAEARADSANSGKTSSTAPTSSFQSFLQKATALKDEISNLARNRDDADSRSSGNAYSNTTTSASRGTTAIDSPIGAGTREYYSYDAASAVESPAGTPNNYGASPSYNPPVRERYYDTYENPAVDSSAWDSRTSATTSFESRSTGASELASFLDAIGGGYDGGASWSSNEYSNSGTTASTYNDYSASREYNPTRNSSSVSATSSSRGYRSSDSSASRARLNSRSYTIN